MNKPTDYPINIEQSETSPDTSTADMTYADLKGRVEAKQLVTDEMIRNARAKLDAAHNNNGNTKQDKSRLDAIREKFRAE